MQKKMKTKSIYICVITIVTMFLGTSCNDKWEDEQYSQLVSFKAPESDNNVSRIRLKYRDDSVHYRLPLIVSGTTVNQRNLDVHVGLDLDTLLAFNLTNFGEGRKDLWYRELDESRYVFSPVTRVPAGECTALIDIQFDFRGLDFSENWMLPLVVQDDPSYNYHSHTKLGFNNALLWLTPFNDYSGTFQTTALNVYADNSNQRLTVSTREAYVVDENSVFFYAGAIDAGRPDRKYFKVKATFYPDETFVPAEGSIEVKKGVVTLEAMNPIEGMEFTTEGTPTYVVTETMDTERPTLMRRVTTITGIKYTFYDPRESSKPIFYEVDGTMSLQRNINTTIPDEEYAIEW